MIHTLKLIGDPKDTPFKYLNSRGSSQVQKLYRKLEKGITFTDGINILIGENGSGKTTILNIIKSLLNCEHSFKTEKPKGFFDWERIAKTSECFELKSDYRKTTFNLYNMGFDKIAMKDNDLICRDSDTFTQFNLMMKESRGQTTMGDLSQLFHIMFDPERQKESFPLSYYVQNFLTGKEYANDVLIKQIKRVEEYISNNSIDDNSFTILMDEPDSGLDVDNLKEVYGILKEPKEQTQIICVVHNALLIHKLSKLDRVNIISLTDNYANTIDDFLEER